MLIRKYKPSDCLEITELFYNTVHNINAKDYKKEQLDAWTNCKDNLEKWNRSLSEHYSIVAICDNTIIGFGDIDNSGFLDRLYVHKDWQRKGIATAICNELEKVSKNNKITVHASITAKPFFEKREYKIIKKQQVQRCGILLTNYIMEKNM